MICNYATPQYFYNRLYAEFKFTLDVCASDKNAKCKNYYTQKDNALEKSWPGIVFCNPPYNKDIWKWIQKAWYESKGGSTVVCLVQARSTDSQWFHSWGMRANEIRFIEDRLYFEINGKPIGRANHASMLLIFRPETRRYPICTQMSVKRFTKI